MNHQDKPSSFYPQRQPSPKATRLFYCPDWSSLSKEAPLYPTSTQPTNPYHQPPLLNLPFYQHEYLYHPIQLRLSIPRFPYPPMHYSYHPHLRDYRSGFQNMACNTQVSYDEESKRFEKQPKIQQREMEEHYLNVKQQPNCQHLQQIKNPFNVQEKSWIDLQIDRKQWGATEKIKLTPRMERVKRYLIKKLTRKYEKRIVYQCRKSVADNRQRSKGRFVKRTEIAQKIPDQVCKKEQKTSV